MRTLVLPLLVATVALSALPAAQAQPTPNDPVSIREAKGWDNQMKKLEIDGNRLLLGAYRASTYIHIDLTDADGRVQLNLQGAALVNYIERILRQNHAVPPVMKEKCLWSNDPQTGDAREDCVRQRSQALTVGKKPTTAAVTTYYSAVITKDSMGMFIKESWLTDKKPADKKLSLD